MRRTGGLETPQIMLQSPRCDSLVHEQSLHQHTAATDTAPGRSRSAARAWQGTRGQRNITHTPLGGASRSRIRCSSPLQNRPWAAGPAPHRRRLLFVRRVPAVREEHVSRVHGGGTGKEELYLLHKCQPRLQVALLLEEALDVRLRSRHRLLTLGKPLHVGELLRGSAQLSPVKCARHRRRLCALVACGPVM